MAVQIPSSHGRYRDSCLAFLHTVAMSDGSIPDHVGWLINMSDQTKVWGVVLDMLFCVFADQSAIYAQEVIVLPGCNIRHLLYKSAVNRVNTTSKHSQTISGLSKYQIIIDEKTDRKHVFGIETKQELDIWYKVLKNASLPDLDLTNELDKSTENHAINADTKYMPREEVLKSTYAPTTRDYPNRAQKMNIPHGQNDSTVHNDDVESTPNIVSSTQSSPQVSKSADTIANTSQLNNGTIQGLGGSSDFGHSATNVSDGILRKASDLKHKLFNKKASKPPVKLRDLNNISLHGFLCYKRHLKWHRLWSIVCQGCFYGFKSQSPEESAHVSVVLANCTVVFVAEKEKKQCRIYIFKLQQVRSKSMYLCVSDYNEFLNWFNVMQKESNGVILNANNINMCSQNENGSICSSASSQSLSLYSVPSTSEISDTSRSRSRNKKHASESPRNSSCPPRTSTDTECSKDAHGSHGLSPTDDTQTFGSASSAVTDPCSGMCNDVAPKCNNALPHVRQNDHGLYLFNTMPRKSSALIHKHDPIYNKDSTRVENKDRLLQNGGVCQCTHLSAEVAQEPKMSTALKTRDGMA